LKRKYRGERLVCPSKTVCTLETVYITSKQIKSIESYSKHFLIWQASEALSASMRERVKNMIAREFAKSVVVSKNVTRSTKHISCVYDYDVCRSDITPSCSSNQPIHQLSKTFCKAGLVHLPNFLENQIDSLNQQKQNLFAMLRPTSVTKVLRGVQARLAPLAVSSTNATATKTRVGNTNIRQEAPAGGFSTATAQAVASTTPKRVHAKEVPSDFANRPSLEIWVVGSRDFKDMDPEWWSDVSFVKTESNRDEDVRIFHFSVFEFPN
jgi:hypothetical protein